MLVILDEYVMDALIAVVGAAAAHVEHEKISIAKYGEYGEPLKVLIENQMKALASLSAAIEKVEG